MFFSGSVQGIGFRNTAKLFAAQQGIKGAVRNAPDGRVEVIAEGTSQALADFYCSLKHYFRGSIKNCEVHESPGTGEFPGFFVEY